MSSVSNLVTHLPPAPPPPLTETQGGWRLYLKESAARFSLRPLLLGICSRPVLFAPIALLFYILHRDLGGGYGVGDQVFHENRLFQFLNGFAVSYLFLFISMIAYLLDADKHWVVSVKPRSGDVGTGFSIRKWWYLKRAWLPLTLVFILLLAFHDWQQRWAFQIGILVPVVLLYAIREYRRRLGLVTLVEDEVNSESHIAIYAPEVSNSSLAVKFIGFLRQHNLEWHAITAAVCFPLVLWLISQGWLLRVSFLLSVWGAAHGLFLYRATARQAASRPTQRLVWGVFVLCFLGYQTLFLYYCFAEGICAAVGMPAPVPPPIFVVLLLLAQLIAIHGFLRYRYGPWYEVVALGVLVFTSLVAAPRFKHRFPHMSYADEDIVQLDEADFEGNYAALMTAVNELEEKPDRQDLLDAVVLKFYRTAKLYHARELRWRERQALANATRPEQADPGMTLDSAEVTAALEQRRFKDVYESLRRWRTAFDELSLRLEQIEYHGLETWKAQASRNGDKPKLAVVAVSGGANRAALWTTLVLDRLDQSFEQQGIALNRHVRLVSGASGGMVGAAYWVSTIDAGQRRHIIDDHDAFVRRIASDSLTPVMHHALFLDVPTMWLPYQFPSDRGLALENAWSKNLDGALDKPIRSLAQSEAEGWRPSLVFSPMLVEDGRRLLISNQNLPFLTESAGASLNPETCDPRHCQMARPAAKPTRCQRNSTLDEARPLRRDRYSLSAVEFFQLFPRQDEFRLSTAVRMSASFPYVSPAGELPRKERRRVVDAGHYDNSGVGVATSWLYQYRDWLAKNTSGVVLIQVRDGMSERQRLYAEDVTLPFEGLTGPLVGLGSAREAGMSFRNDEMVQVLNDYFNARGKPMFTTVVFEAHEDIAMSWYLTRNEVNRMMGSFDPAVGETAVNRKSIERLVKWWGKDHSR